MDNDGAPPRTTVLVVGGSGAFGSRLVDGLVATTECRVLIGARDFARAERIAAGFSTDRVRAVRIDAAHVTSSELRTLGADIVVDAAGPFQASNLHLAEVTIAQRLPFLDLADGRDYVADFARLDAMAKHSGTVALTGASSTPALSNAALDAISEDWQRVEWVSIAITPGNRAPRGLSVVQAILSYAGRPVNVLHAGVWRPHPGWGLMSRETLPGLGTRWLSLCETPDLDILPMRYPQARHAVFRAGLELPILHLGLWLATIPVRWRWIRTLRPLSRPFRRLASWFESFGSDRGGMIVEARGHDRDGAPTRAIWSLVAEAGDGPFVPTLPALAIIRRFIDDDVSLISPGARVCIGTVGLTAIEDEMSRHRILTHRTVAHPPSCFRHVLGSRFDLMPKPIRELHDVAGCAIFRGEASVDRGQGWLANAIAALFCLPPTMEKAPVEVTIVTEGEASERWIRRFGHTRFSSVMSPLTASSELEERFGPLSIRLAVEATEAGLGMAVRGWRLGPIPMPKALSPSTIATESVDEVGRFRFDVALFLPLIGQLVRYRGWLQPETGD